MGKTYKTAAALGLVAVLIAAGKPRGSAWAAGGPSCTKTVNGAKIFVPCPPPVAPPPPAAPPDPDAWRKPCDDAHATALKGCRAIQDARSRGICTAQAHEAQTVCLKEHGG